jgi:hypothetical protein
MREAHLDGACVVQSRDLFVRQFQLETCEVVFQLRHAPGAYDWNDRNLAVAQPCQSNLSGRMADLLAYFLEGGDNPVRPLSRALERFGRFGRKSAFCRAAGNSNFGAGP